MSNNLKSLKDFVKKSLGVRNWSERELAKKANLSPPTVNEFLAGNDRDIKTESLRAICNALEVPLFYILMSPEDREKWDSLNTPIPHRAGSSFREKLAISALALDESLAKEMFEQIQHHLETRSHKSLPPLKKAK